MSRNRTPSRRERRVLLALLSGASNLSGFPLGRAAQVGSGTVYVILARMERDGLVAAEQEERTDGRARRRFYHLTYKGRIHALSVLGLQEDGRTASKGDQ